MPAKATASTGTRRGKAPAPAKAPRQAGAGFEATCPTCGMTSDVGADAEHVRCRRCGTVIRLVDHPVAPGPPAASAVPPMPSTAPPQSSIPFQGWALAVGLGAPAVVLLLFAIGHDALDEPAPDTGTAGVLYLLAVLAAAAALFSLRPILGAGRVLPGALWGILPALAALALMSMAGQAYDDDGVAWVILGMPVLVVYGVAVGITAAVLGSRRPGEGAAAVLFGGAGLCAGLAVGIAYLLMTLQEQAAAAREAHEAPAWGFLLVAGTLVAMAAWRRR